MDFVSPASQDHIAIDYHQAGAQRIAAQLWHIGRQ
jgi:2,4-dienoyl-CoA reductase-like NADH-dependent reductase (Old Yellow Enzyme family)